MKLPDETKDFWRGVQWAANQIESEAHDLSGVRDGYIEARKTGEHAGRRISEAMAKEFAMKFHERSDALFMAADSITEAGRSAISNNEGDRK